MFAGSIIESAIGAHAVVNASNPSVVLGSGISGALREACGGFAFQREIREALAEEFGEKLKPEDCLVTGSGTCSAFRWVLHVPSVDYDRPDPETGGPTGPRRVTACARAALLHAVELARSEGLSGAFVLATPLLGAGAGGLGAVGSADAMMEGFREATSEMPGDQAEVIARVVFAVLQPEHARVVALAAAKHGLPFEVA